MADAEGFPEIAKRSRNIATVEKHHEERYRALTRTSPTARSSRRTRRHLEVP